MLNLKEEQLLFFDIECYKYDSFVIFKDINKVEVAKFHNDFRGLWDVIKDKTIVGFNNYHYDDVMITFMLKLSTPEQLKRINDRIIVKGERIRTDIRIKSLDVYQQISVSRSGLKKIAANMGKSIIESSVGFDIDRKLTLEELEAEMSYCNNDVDLVVDIWKLRKKSYFETKNELLKMYENPAAKKWNTTTISANLLMDKPAVAWSSLRVESEILDLVPVDVKNMWSQANNLGIELKQKTKTITEFNNKIVFGFGGLHGTRVNGRRFENVKLADVKSFYPQMVINMDILGSSTPKYKSIFDERSLIKHKDFTRSDALKLILNSVYGQLNSKYSMLFNTRALYTVCIHGQAILYELGKRLGMSSDVIQLNTDGVMFDTENDLYLQTCKEWEKEFGMVLEFEDIDLLIQRDVNNYIAVQGDQITLKGGDVGRYNTEKPFDNNSLRIIDIAIVDYLLYNIDVITTLQNNIDKPELFQFILSAGRTYQGTFDTEGNKYNKVNRAFACKENTPHKVDLRKKRIDDGLDRFPNTSENLMIWNDDIEGFKDFSKYVDLNFYYKLINTKLEKWTN